MTEDRSFRWVHTYHLADSVAIDVVMDSLELQRVAIRASGHFLLEWPCPLWQVLEER